MQHEIPEHKVCPNCNIDKPSSEYHRNAARKDGLTYVCAECIPIYEAKEKRPKRKLSSLNKTCDKCGRSLTSRMFQYAQHTEDHLRPSCRTCSSFKPKRNPSMVEITTFEDQMQLIFSEAKSKFDPDKNRSELENFVWKRMLEDNLLETWSPPVWVHKSSVGGKNDSEIQGP